MTYPREITARLLDADGSVVAGDPLANSFDRSFFDEWNGPGRGQISLPVSEAGAAELVPGRYVDVMVAGTSRFTFKIEGNPQYRQVQRGEEYEQVVTVAGRGWACVLDEAITYPEYSQQFVLDTTWRLFSFASKNFPNDGAWTAAVEQAEYLEGVATADCYGHQQTAPDGLAYPAPIGWPWGTNPFNLVSGVKTGNYVDQFWIRTSDQPTYVSSGYYFFRRQFTLADFTAVTFDVTGDNFFTLYLEGVPILGEKIQNADHWMWQGWKSHQMWLPAGTYQLGAVVYNISFADIGATAPVVQPACPSEGFAGGARYENTGGLLCAIYSWPDPTAAPDGIAFSDDSWTSHYEPEYFPGWTAGQIIDQLIGEAVARGALVVYSSSTYTDSLDSAGLAWRPLDTTYDREDIPSIAFEVDSGLMQVLTKMQQLGWINWHVRPGTFVLDVFRGRNPAPSSSATFTAGVNIVALERNATAPYANALRVQWEGGYTVVDNPTAIAAYGTRVEASYASEAPTEKEAIVDGENQLARMAQEGLPSIVMAVEPTSAADCPYEGFTLGQYVTVPTAAGGTEIVRCYSINCNEDEEGNAVWSGEFNARLDVPERRRLELLEQIGGKNQIVRGRVR